MPGQEIITNLRTEDIESVLMREPTLLVACIRGTNCHEILEMIESVAIFFGPGLNVCYAREDLFPYFEKALSRLGNANISPYKTWQHP